jgi:hypothetical protein
VHCYSSRQRLVLGAVEMRTISLLARKALRVDPVQALRGD